jgi:short-subunit dehydrogenase
VKVSVVCPGYIKTPIFETSKVIKINREKLLEALPDRLGITPEKCATLILRGVARNKAFIVVTGFAKTLWVLHRINPRILFWMMRRTLIRSRKEARIED